MIIERRPGYTNEMMVEQLQRLERVLSQTKKVKKGKGKKSRFIDVPKYSDSEKELENIRRSIDYYSKQKEDDQGT